MTTTDDHAEPEDTCRPVEIDGETISVRGATELTEEGRTALTALVRAAKAKMAAEPPPARQQLRAVAFNAVAPALRLHGEWLRLSVRRTVADAVLSAVGKHLIDLTEQAAPSNVTTAGEWECGWEAAMEAVRAVLTPAAAQPAGVTPQGVAAAPTPTATEATQPSTTGYCPACGRGDLAPTADDWEQQRKRAETAESRLHLAHEARRGKEHQLDDVRRALCDIGFMDDDDPYSHADLADVIRQNGQALRESGWRPEDHAGHGSPCERQPDGACSAPAPAAPEPAEGTPCSSIPGCDGQCCKQAPADDEAQRTTRRDSLHNLLGRAQRTGLTWDEGALLHEHVEAEMREADAARAELTRSENARDHLRRRAEQVEQLLRIAYETSNQSEAERARAAQRADIAETELRTLRAGLRANGADPTQIQNLWAQISLRNRQWRETKRELALTRSMLEAEGGDVALVDEMVDAVAKAEREAREAQATIERVRAIKRAPQRSQFNTLANAQDNGWDAALHAVHEALDGAEQPSTEA